MPNYQQAPELKYNGEKTTNNQFYSIPQELADIIFNKLGNSSAQLRIMMVLVGTKEGFRISEKWILDRTGLQHASYINARKALVNRGWITLEAAESITVNFDAIRKENNSNTILPQPSNTILPQPSNTILPQPSNTILPITNNITDKKTDNKTDNLGARPCVPQALSQPPVVENKVEELKPITLEQAKQFWGNFELCNGVVTSPEGRKFRLVG